MKVLLIGATGMLGQTLYNVFTKEIRSYHCSSFL